MTRFKQLRVLVLIATSSALAMAQTPARTDWQRMFELGLKYRTASDLYMALKSAGNGGQQSPVTGRVFLPDCSGDNFHRDFHFRIDIDLSRKKAG